VQSAKREIVLKFLITIPSILFCFSVSLSPLAVGSLLHEPPLPWLRRRRRRDTKDASRASHGRSGFVRAISYFHSSAPLGSDRSCGSRLVSPIPLFPFPKNVLFMVLAGREGRDIN
jgi:hypothetical protein